MPRDNEFLNKSDVFPDLIVLKSENISEFQNSGCKKCKICNPRSDVIKYKKNILINAIK